MNTQDIIAFELPSSWISPLKDQLSLPYLRELKAFLEIEALAGHTVYPPKNQIFEALRLTPFDAVKVVIVGQDPYHGEGQAHGLCFSVLPGIALPPSLKNIYKELQEDIQIPPASHGCLASWAQQGVLLLNTTLTVRKGEPLSHYKQGWEKFTDAIIEAIARQKQHIVFILWGKNAQEKCLQFSDALQSHCVLTAAPPSPFSAASGFFGCRHFSKTNAYLQEHGKTPIQWALPES
jgi:uracil-DNA glycosylase